VKNPERVEHNATATGESENWRRRTKLVIERCRQRSTPSRHPQSIFTKTMMPAVAEGPGDWDLYCDYGGTKPGTDREGDKRKLGHRALGAALSIHVGQKRVGLVNPELSDASSNECADSVTVGGEGEGATDLGKSPDEGPTNQSRRCLKSEAASAEALSQEKVCNKESRLGDARKGHRKLGRMEVGRRRLVSPKKRNSS